MAEIGKPKLTAIQKARIERNRLKALSLRQGKLVNHPSAKNTTNAAGEVTTVIKVAGTKFVDSGGGFLIEQDVLPSKPSAEEKAAAAAKVQVESVTIPITHVECIECGDLFVDSFLFDNFGHKVCDKCRQPDDVHSLITRTEAKAEYLLKDCDFDERTPPLRYISRKNPHNVRWGEMKLYLHLQVEQRALEVWGSEAELMKQHESREEKRDVAKLRKYNKRMKELRMEMRSSLYTKKTKGVHVHEYGEETYNEDEDNYTHVCLQCGFVETYEKM